jgi:hypothetical protein
VLTQEQNTRIRGGLATIEGREHHPPAEIAKPHPENTLFFRSPPKRMLWL